MTHSDDDLRRAIEVAMNEAAHISAAALRRHAEAHYSGEPVRVFKCGDDTLSESAAKAYCAGEILEAIRALSPDDILKKVKNDQNLL